MSFDGSRLFGKGITYPFIPNKRGALDIETGRELVQSCVNILLTWPIGTRLLLREYGTDLNNLIEEPNDVVSQSLALRSMTDAIEEWEPRISNVYLRVESQTPDRIYIEASYVLNESGIEDTFTFPFYTEIER